ncbi:Dynein heavy chain 6, axonemal [Nymphon striatum]|nr:Dynein heavy chain 6, axonemal [Nymphon striatum]
MQEDSDLEKMETLSLDVFEILRHCDSSKFLYLTHKYSIKSRKYNPYSLVLTSYDDINIKNYFTIDSEDFIHHYDCGSEIIDEFQWERENDLYNKLIKIDVFAKFKLMKYFSHWIKLIRAKKMKKASEVITSRVHIFDKNLRKSLTDICEMCSIIEEKNFLLSVNFFQASFEVFYVLQLEHLKQLTSNLNDFRELLLEIVYDGCNKSLKVTGFNVNHLHDMGHTKEALKKWHCEKLTRYIRLVDYIFFTTLYKLFHNSLVALLKFLTENVQNINPSHGNIEEKIKYQECQVKCY